ncbi:unnamed protein product [Brassica rapa]|uniref:Uncharacterized protein n=3 Tax=Brassica TaxID=3705 RepID=A0A3P6CZJ4_BRACM|nr:unnamed protein product [Brassica napus]CAG7908405.1 unnamed protein product [Brassica rapa]VDD15821.1 unnamed protein product [Brassica rapa]
MGPKQKPKQKQKQPVVYEEDYVPIKTLIDYGIDAETVKILGDAKIWNSLLIKNKELLAGVDGLSEIKFDQICEAVDKLMASLTSQVQVFTQTVLLENIPRKRCMSECIEACYSLDEMHETLSRKFGQSFKTTKNTKLEKEEQAGNQVQSSENMEQAESLLPIQDEVELPKPTEVQSNTEQKEQDGDQVQSSEEKEQDESLLPIQDEVELPKSTEAQSTSEQKEQAHSESVLPILTQLINSQKEILEAITSQNKMLESVMNLQTEIATKDDLESLERDLGRRLEAIGEDITLQVANGIQEILTSASKTSVEKFEKAVTSKVNISR